LGQPQPGAVAEQQECGLRLVAGLRDSPQSPSWWWREVRVVKAWTPRCGPPMPGDLHRPDRPDVYDDDLLAGAGAVDPDPHDLAEQVGWDRVLPAVEGHHRGLCGNGAGHPERDRVRGQR